MKFLFQGLLLFTLLNFALPATAVQIEFHSFENAQREKLYLDLIAELRCVKCQNQNLAESNAELATDMREKTYEMISAGKSREDVVNYMTARYGDFVLYRPAFKMKTLLLWLGPIVFLLLAIFFVIRWVRGQAKADDPVTLSKTQQASVRDLLK